MSKYGGSKHLIAKSKASQLLHSLNKAHGKGSASIILKGAPTLVKMSSTELEIRGVKYHSESNLARPIPSRLQPHFFWMYLTVDGGKKLDIVGHQEENVSPFY
jgi:hypothetical protein